MKLQLEARSGGFTVTGYGDGYIMIDHVRYERSLVVMPDRLAQRWASAGFMSLTADDFASLRDLTPDIVLLGTGRSQRFPHPSVFRPLIEARIGYEVMDSAAACRTYNILMTEGRRVAAALLID